MKRVRKQKLTDFRRRALEIIRDNPGIWPARFAELAWPDSEGWRRQRKCGNHGAHRGGGMYVAAGQYLGKLRREGLIYSHSKTGQTCAYLTGDGRDALRESDDEKTATDPIQRADGPRATG